MVVGNLENWAALFTNQNGKLILDNVLLPSPMKFFRNSKKLIDSQIELLQNIKRLVQARNIEFNCNDKRINQYLAKNTKESNIAEKIQNAKIKYNGNIEPAR